MALVPFIRTLTKRVRALVPIIRSGVRKGLGSRAINEVLRRTTLERQGVRRSVLLSIMEKEREQMAAAANLKFLAKANRPDPRRLPLSITDIITNYSFTVRMTGHLRRTGEPVTWWQTVVTDELLSRGELEGTAWAAAEDDPQTYDVVVTGATLQEGVRSFRLTA